MNDNATNVATDRTIRIERLRLQAALDRERVSQASYRLADACRPSTIFGNLMSQTSWVRPGNLLNRSAHFLSDYPYVAASLSSLLIGRKSRMLRMVGLVVGSIGAWRAVIQAATRDQSKR
jgi:hypothetical protein